MLSFCTSVPIICTSPLALNGLGSLQVFAVKVPYVFFFFSSHSWWSDRMQSSFSFLVSVELCFVYVVSFGESFVRCQEGIFSVLG